MPKERQEARPFLGGVVKLMKVQGEAPLLSTKCVKLYVRDGLRALSTEVQELRSALRRLASHVMWHNGAVVGSQEEPTGDRSCARTSGTTPSSVHQATGGVQRVTSPQKAASSMKHSGGEDSDDEKWFSGDEHDDSVSRIHEGPEPVAAETLEVVEIIPKERISERTHIVDMPVLRFFERARRTCPPV